MDRNKLVDLLRAIFGNPFYNSYIRSNVPETPLEEKEEKELTDEMKAFINAITATPVATVSPTFKLVFWAVLLLTVLFALLAVIIAFFAPQPLTSTQQAVFETFNLMWKVGFGAIVGLIGGKAT